MEEPAFTPSQESTGEFARTLYAYPFSGIVVEGSGFRIAGLGFRIS